MRVFALTLFVVANAFALTQTTFPDAPLRETVSEIRRQVRPGITHIYRVTADPMRINVLVVDLKQPGLSIRTVLSNDRVVGTETVLSMAQRTQATAGVNGDYWGPNGIEQGFTVTRGRIAIAPKFRTAFTIDARGRANIGMFTDAWTWKARAFAPDGTSRDIVLLNSELNPGWLNLYNDLYGAATFGNTYANTTEVVIDEKGRVAQVRTNQPGVTISAGRQVLAGRDAAGEWLRTKFKVGDEVRLELNAGKPMRMPREAIGAGPRILKDGKYFQDPLALFPNGEEFDAAFKQSHYLQRQPRTAIGHSADGRRVVIVTVDGRMSAWSIGIFQKQMAGLLAEFGAAEGMDLDSGGSTTMVIDNQVVNRPSDGASPNGTGGRQRSVANGLMIYTSGR